MIHQSAVDEDDGRPFALVVDDDVLILMDASDILHEAGFRALEAHSFDAAETLLVEYADEIVLLFTDVQMPGRDGFELARMTAERWPDIGILIASGLADPSDGFLPDGAVFVRKPFHSDLIFEHLQMLLPDGKLPEPLKQKTRQH
jgi:FixJ family two-component response regulator